MAVNVPLVTISGLTEQATAADTDCMVIGGTDAKKIKWSTIISLIRTKLGIGSTSLNGIGDGTVTGAISSLNTDIKDSGWLTSPDGAVAYRLKCGIVTVDIYTTTADIYPTFSSAIFTIPNGYRPSRSFYFDATNGVVDLLGNIGADGAIKFRSRTGQAVKGIVSHFSYPIG